MRKVFNVFWETDYCDDFPERDEVTEIEAADEKEAAEKFRRSHLGKCIVYAVERKSQK